MSSYRGVEFTLLPLAGQRWEYEYAIGDAIRTGTTTGAIELIAERNMWAQIDRDLRRQAACAAPLEA